MGRLSLEKLQSHINQIHPRDLDSQSFPVCAHLGSYQNTYFKCDCCCPEKVSELSQEINIGPSMFLMSTKQIMKFFFLVIIINVPLYLFYANTTDQITECTDLLCYFDHLGLGAIGEMQKTCASNANQKK